MVSSLPSAPMDRMLSAVLQIVPEAILSAPGKGRALRWASQFPTFALESTFGFESRLDEEPAECDVCLSVQPGSRFSNHLIRCGAHAQATAAARGLGRFLAEVTEPESFLSQWFRSVILEYDLVASPAPGTEPPGVFIKPHYSVLDVPGNSKPPGHGRGLTCNHRVMTSAICWAVGRDNNGAEHQAMGRVHRALPRGATTEQLGALPGREPRAVRLVLRIPKTEVAPFLERIEWTGPVVQLGRVLHWLDRWQSGTTALSVACDVSADGVSTRLAFELFLREPWHRGRVRFWAPLIGHFVEKGWCTRGKATALLAWPEGDYLLTESGVYQLLTGINHLKLVIDGDRIASKAYMGALLLPK